MPDEVNIQALVEEYRERRKTALVGARLIKSELTSRFPKESKNSIDITCDFILAKINKGIHCAKHDKASICRDYEYGNINDDMIAYYHKLEGYLYYYFEDQEVLEAVKRQKEKIANKFREIHRDRIIGLEKGIRFDEETARKISSSENPNQDLIKQLKDMIIFRRIKISLIERGFCSFNSSIGILKERISKRIQYEGTIVLRIVAKKIFHIKEIESLEDQYIFNLTRERPEKDIGSMILILQALMYKIEYFSVKEVKKETIEDIYFRYYKKFNSFHLDCERNESTEKELKEDKRKINDHFISLHKDKLESLEANSSKYNDILSTRVFLDEVFFQNRRKNIENQMLVNNITVQLLKYGYTKFMDSVNLLSKYTSSLARNEEEFDTMDRFEACKTYRIPELSQLENEYIFYGISKSQDKVNFAEMCILFECFFFTILYRSAKRRRIE